MNSLLPLNFAFSVSFQRLTFGMSPFLPQTAMPFPELAIDKVSLLFPVDSELHVFHLIISISL